MVIVLDAPLGVRWRRYLFTALQVINWIPNPSRYSKVSKILKWQYHDGGLQITTACGSVSSLA